MKNNGIKTTSSSDKTSERMSSNHSSSIVMRAVALFVTVISVIVLMAFVFAVAVLFIPWLSISLFQQTGIQVAAGLTFAEFSVGDFVVLVMMWFLPSVFLVMLVAAAQWKLCKAVLRWVKKLLRKAFKKCKVQ